MEAVNRISYLIFALSVAVSLVFYPFMPQTMATHWGADGQVNGFMGKSFAIFLMPLVILSLAIIIPFVIKHDPLSKNIAKFKKYADGVVYALLFFMIYIHTVTLVWNLEFVASQKISITYALIPAFSILFYFLGIVLGKSKRNYTIGVRTPWTLANDVVWNKTHIFAEKMFKMVAIICLLSLFFSTAGFLGFIILLFGAVISIVVYSYVVYRLVVGVKKKK